MKKSETLQMRAALERAIEEAGGIASLAQLLPETVTRQAVYKWRNESVPPERAVQIERALKGAVRRHDLRPDLFIHCSSADQAA